MAYTLYKAPNCIRCRITHEFMDSHSIPYSSFDLEADKDTVNAFYRTNRKFLHRNETGVEFPMFYDDETKTVLQGTGVVISWLLSGTALLDCGAVSESKLLHGWISGLNLSLVPTEKENEFIQLITALADGGLKVVLDSDGRNSALMERLINLGKITKIRLNIPGPAEFYSDKKGPSAADLKKSITLVRNFNEGIIRLFLTPLQQADGTYTWLSAADAALAGKMIKEACGNDTLFSFGIQATADLPKGVEPLANLLPYRSKLRAFLPKTDIMKDPEH